MEQGLLQLWASTGIANFTAGQVVMIAISGMLIYLAIMNIAYVICRPT